MKPREGLYAYGIIEGGEQWTFGNVFTIPYQDLAIVVSRAPGRVWRLSPEDIKRHQEVVAAIVKERIVLPMAFGMVITGKADARQLLLDHYNEIKRALDAVRGKMELGLKVLWQKDALAVELERHEHLRVLKAKIHSMPSEQAYPEIIRLGQMVEATVLENRRLYEQLIYQPLVELAVDAALNKPIGERMVFNAAFLVQIDMEEMFDEKVNSLYAQYRDLFMFKYTGPWPPYNFVDLSLNLAD